MKFPSVTSLLVGVVIAFAVAICFDYVCIDYSPVGDTEPPEVSTPVDDQDLVPVLDVEVITPTKVEAVVEEGLRASMRGDIVSSLAQSNGPPETVVNL